MQFSITEIIQAGADNLQRKEMAKTEAATLYLFCPLTLASLRNAYVVASSALSSPNRWLRSVFASSVYTAGGLHVA